MRIPHLTRSDLLNDRDSFLFHRKPFSRRERRKKLIDIDTNTGHKSSISREVEKSGLTYSAAFKSKQHRFKNRSTASGRFQESETGVKAPMAEMVKKNPMTYKSAFESRVKRVIPEFEHKVESRIREDFHNVDSLHKAALATCVEKSTAYSPLLSNIERFKNHKDMPYSTNLGPGDFNADVNNIRKKAPNVTFPTTETRRMDKLKQDSPIGPGRYFRGEKHRSVISGSQSFSFNNTDRWKSAPKDQYINLDSSDLRMQRDWTKPKVYVDKDGKRTEFAKKAVSRSEGGNLDQGTKMTMNTSVKKSPMKFASSFKSQQGRFGMRPKSASDLGPGSFDVHLHKAVTVTDPECPSACFVSTAPVRIDVRVQGGAYGTLKPRFSPMSKQTMHLDGEASNGNIRRVSIAHRVMKES